MIKKEISSGWVNIYPLYMYVHVYNNNNYNNGILKYKQIP